MPTTANRFADNPLDLIKFEDLQFNHNSNKIKRKFRRILDWCAQFRHMQEFGHPARGIYAVFGTNSTDLLNTQLTKCFLLRTNTAYSDGKGNCDAFTCKYALVEREINKAHEFIYSWSLNEAINLIEEKKEEETSRTHRAPAAYCNQNEQTDKANHPFYKLLGMSKFQELEARDRDLIVSNFTKYHDELIGTKQIEYTDKSHRLWHPMQNISRAGKDCLFEAFGLNHDYDLEAAAATLITEFCRRSGYIEDKQIPFVMDYIADRNLFRRTLSNKYDITQEQSKSIFACLVNRAPINPVFDTCGYSRIFSDDVEGYIKACKIARDPYITRFKGEMKQIWRMSLVALNMDAFKNNSPVGAITNKKKFMLYFQQERAMLDLMRNYLDKIGARYFLEHDGFRSDKEINLDEILTYMKEETGYSQLKIS